MTTTTFAALGAEEKNRKQEAKFVLKIVEEKKERKAKHWLDGQVEGKHAAPF